MSNTVRPSSDSDKESSSPVSKRQKTSDTSPTPHSKWYKSLESVRASQHTDITVIIRGLDDEEAEQENDTLTKEQVDKIRLVLLTKAGNDALKEMGKLILREEYGESLQCFNTSYSYSVLESYDIFKLKYSRMRKWPDKFNLIFGFTFELFENTYWMRDHVCGYFEVLGGKKMISGLARMWKNLLKKTDEQLGIDAEFTRPGVIFFLNKVKNDVKDIKTYAKLNFNFQ